MSKRMGLEIVGHVFVYSVYHPVGIINRSLRALRSTIWDNKEALALCQSGKLRPGLSVELDQAEATYCLDHMDVSHQLGLCVTTLDFAGHDILKMLYIIVPALTTTSHCISATAEHFKVRSLVYLSLFRELLALQQFESFHCPASAITACPLLSPFCSSPSSSLSRARSAHFHLQP